MPIRGEKSLPKDYGTEANKGILWEAVKTCTMKGKEEGGENLQL